MDQEETSNLIQLYESKIAERHALNREIAAMRDVIVFRIAKSETNEITTDTQRVFLQSIVADRVKSIKEIEAEFGGEWIDENRRRIVKTVESKRLRIEPKN